MKKFFFPILLSIGLVFASACSLASESGSWRYRMTVEIETPEGIKSGSAVREVILRRRDIGNQNVSFASTVRGEAVVIDMGEKGALFALLRSNRTVDHGWRAPFYAFPMPGRPNGGGEATTAGFQYYSSLKNVSAELAFEDYPLFVRFKDPTDPTSMELVYSSGMCEAEPKGRGFPDYPCVHTDRFEEIYGPGVKLHSIVIEMTEDEVTWGIEKRLPWLISLNGKYLHGGTTSRNAPLGLHGGDFSKEQNNEW